MKDEFYVTLTRDGAKRLTKRYPTLSRSEIGVRVRISVPDSAFRSPVVSVDVSVPEEHIVQPIVELEALAPMEDEANA